MQIDSVIVMFMFFFKGTLPLSGICVKKLDNNGAIKNAFEISGKHIYLAIIY